MPNLACTLGRMNQRLSRTKNQTWIRPATAATTNPRTIIRGSSELDRNGARRRRRRRVRLVDGAAKRSADRDRGDGDQQDDQDLPERAEPLHGALVPSRPKSSESRITSSSSGVETSMSVARSIAV